MALFTTYLSALKNIDQRGKRVYYVMRDRGNNQVAPTKVLLIAYKNGNITWEQYAKNYTEQIQTSSDAISWIDKVAEQSLFEDVLLVCFEKNQNHCHRSLLAIQITFRHPEVNYIGDLHPFSTTVQTLGSENKTGAK